MAISIIIYLESAQCITLDFLPSGVPTDHSCPSMSSSTSSTWATTSGNAASQCVYAGRAATVSAQGKNACAGRAAAVLPSTSISLHDTSETPGSYATNSPPRSPPSPMHPRTSLWHQQVLIWLDCLWPLNQ
jgi:hypothetical protein